MEELTILDHYAVHTEGNYAIVVDTRTNKVIDKFNIKREAFKQNLKKAGLITLAALVLATSTIAGVKHKKANLEARTNNIIQVKENNSRQYQNLTFYQDEKTDGERLEKGDDIMKNIEKAYADVSSIGIKIPEYIDKPQIRSRFLVECSDNPHVVSKAGARGYPQTYYDTWKDVFPNDSYSDFKRGIKNEYKSALFILKHTLSLDRFNRENCPGYNQMSHDERKKILDVEYNWGTGNLQNNFWNLAKAPKESKNYIKKMQIAYSRFI